MTSPPQRPAPASDGRLVGERYRLLTCLGRGGMGIVWAGRDEVLVRAVAIKEVTPPPGLTDEQREQLRERTLREARAAARINSRAAVTVYDVVEEDGRPWIVMELLPPRTLADVLREEGPLPEEAAAHVGLRVLDALSAAHGAGVLHRDVKPANVLYDATGQAVLTDFGIASLEGDPSMTTTGTIIGSPGYVAPERALGQPPSPASDLWSLGVLLATAVHGRSPFERDSPLATLVAGLHDPLPEWASDGPLGQVLVGLLAKDPKDRPDLATVRAMLERSAASSAPATARLQPAGDEAERTQALSLPVAAAALPDVPADTGPPPPAPEPESSPAVAAPPVRRRHSRALMAALAVAALTAVAVIALLFLDVGTGDGPGTDSGTAADRGTSATDTATGSGNGSDPDPTETPEPTEPTEPTESSGPGGGGESDPDDPVVASGYKIHKDSEYKVALPKGWSITEETETRKVFSDPESSRYLLVEEGGEPNGDPFVDWQNQEAYVSESGRFPGYQLIGIERSDFRDFIAADWQFTWDASYGPVRVLNRAVVDGDQAFALYWSVPEDQWEESMPVFEDIAASFEPRG